MITKNMGTYGGYSHSGRATLRIWLSSWLAMAGIKCSASRRWTWQWWSPAQITTRLECTSRPSGCSQNMYSRPFSSRYALHWYREWVDCHCTDSALNVVGWRATLPLIRQGKVLPTAQHRTWSSAQGHRASRQARRITRLDFHFWKCEHKAKNYSCRAHSIEVQKLT